MGSATRTATLVLVALAFLLLVASFFVPWWSVQTGLTGEQPRDKDEYRPFLAVEQGPRTGELNAHTRILGGLAVASGVFLLAAVARAVRPAAGVGVLRWMAVGATLAGLLAVLFTMLGFPAAAENVHGVDLEFQGQKCTVTGLCFRTGPHSGWWLAIGATALALAAAAMPRGTAAVDRQESVAPPAVRATPPPLPPKVVAGETPTHRPDAPKVGGTGVKVIKCPQCQTRLGFARVGPPQLVVCPNCGLRVAT